MFDNFDVFLAVILLFGLTTFVSAIGLLKGKNWGRVGFIGLMGVGIIWNLAGLVFTFVFVGSMPQVPDAREIDGMMTVIMVGNVVVIGALCVLFGWIIHRLRSAQVRAEFVG